MSMDLVAQDIMIGWQLAEIGILIAPLALLSMQ